MPSLGSSSTDAVDNGISVGFQSDERQLLLADELEALATYIRQYDNSGISARRTDADIGQGGIMSWGGDSIRGIKGL